MIRGRGLFSLHSGLSLILGAYACSSAETNSGGAFGAHFTASGDSDSGKESASLEDGESREDEDPSNPSPSDSGSGSDSGTPREDDEKHDDGSVEEETSESESESESGTESESDTGTESEGESESGDESESESDTESETESESESESESGGESGETGEEEKAEEMPPIERQPLIWIANSSEGTISKIDTQTMTELGRFPTAASPNEPSGTSIDMNGDVVVAGRKGGITKIIADPLRCSDINESGAVETSVDSTPLAFTDDECIAWHVAPGYLDFRMAVWNRGLLNPANGMYEEQGVWVAGTGPNPLTGEMEAVLYDGETGERIGFALIEGAHSGVVDGFGNLWMVNGASDPAEASLQRVNPETFETVRYDVPVGGYGMTIGGKEGGRNYLWVCGQQIARFDPSTELWNTSDPANSLGQSHTEGGCVVDSDGVLWHASIVEAGPDALPDTPPTYGIQGIDSESMSVIATHPMPEHAHGVTMDFDGFLWAVGRSASTAYKVDLGSGGTQSFTGLVGADTYSDLTGFVLATTEAEIDI